MINLKTEHGWWQLFFTKEELLFDLQNMKKVNGSHTVRILITIANIVILATAFYFSGWPLFYFFTNWALLLTILYISMSVIAANYTSNMNLLACHHILFSTSLFANIVVTTIYWPLLHSQYISIEEIAENPVRIAVAYGMHSMPIIGSIYNFRTIDAVLKASHAKALIPGVALYLYTNYRATRLSGQTLYWFLTWEDWRSAFVVIGLYTLLLGAFHLCARLTIKLRPIK